MHTPSAHSKRRKWPRKAFQRICTHFSPTIFRSCIFSPFFLVWNLPFLFGRNNRNKMLFSVCIELQKVEKKYIKPFDVWAFQFLSMSATCNFKVIAKFVRSGAYVVEPLNRRCVDVVFSSIRGGRIVGYVSNQPPTLNLCSAQLGSKVYAALMHAQSWIHDNKSRISIMSKSHAHLRFGRGCRR